MKTRFFTLFLSFTLLFTMNSFVFAAPSASVAVESGEEIPYFEQNENQEDSFDDSEKVATMLEAGAVKVRYQAIATPHCAVSGEEVTNNIGFDAIMFQLTSDKINDNTIAPSLTYIRAEQLGLDASQLDNYFLSNFDMYVTLDDNNKISSVLLWKSLMVKKTVNDLKFDTVTTNKADSYY